MIYSKILKAATGVQVGDVVDNTESTSLPSTSSGVLVGRFKRGRTDKPFKVTKANYQALLGRDLRSPSYAAVDDAIARGVSELWVQRIGSSDQASGGGGNVDVVDEWVHDGYVYDYKAQSTGLADGQLNFVSDILIDGEYGGVISGVVKTQMLDLALSDPAYKESLFIEIFGNLFSVGGIAKAFYSKSQYGVQGVYPKGATHIAFGASLKEGDPIAFRGLTKRTAHHLAKMRYANYYADSATNKIKFQELPKSVEVRLAAPTEQSIAFVEAMHNTNKERPVFNRQSVVSYGVALNHGNDIVVNSTLRACIPQSTIDTKLKTEFASVDFSGYVKPSSSFEVDYVAV